ncbi:MAG: dTDP-glucose 4,6-dehydratase [Desulfarculaceae bacterium]|nr:dTDP-glucose 4,6-dehydratase [Desulfarculaceae bacterium]MCF8072097.1 dTDP-glucose 4,6-dehydratase [Desulfarculaceae bacterium]MCF8100018.1 dTDP-glucose 4,6-dehydratase [Desulfarculaceae bacterium]
MSILVTGGAGFIGSNYILDWLAECDEPVINVDKLTYAGNPHNLAAVKDKHDGYSFVQCDINDYDQIVQLLKKHGIRAIVNFAAESHVDRSIHRPEDFIQTNIVGTYRLLEAAKEHWGALPEEDQEAFRFLHISTDEVYGSLEPDDPPFREGDCYRPNSPYSASKASSDHLVRAYHQTYGLPAIIVNCSNNYGPFQLPEKLIPMCIFNALSGDPIYIYGDGQQIRDWLYVKDHCKAIRLVLDQGLAGKTYNIGGEAEKTNLQVVHAICEILDRTTPGSGGNSYAEQIEFIKDRLGHDRRYAIDTTMIKNELGWKPDQTFEAGIEKTVAWYLANQDWVATATGVSYKTWVETHYKK